jgi:ribosomal protein S27AE
MPVDLERSRELIDALTRKGATNPCPRCGNGQFSIVDETTIQIQPDAAVITFEGPVVPVVVTACSRCGYVSMHALGALGVAPHVGAAHAG